MTNTPDLTYAITLPPEQAIEYFQAKESAQGLGTGSGLTNGH